ncbi:hypothetical protein CEN39_11025 [Fischerella thermalis CCMEE 5201]|jgi:outer membrane protein assembly factor BamE (lipoprotein component of BamABCDE complex)|nr:hypothetical protein CEN39_11025 [Fischerella thermalis CCMEE 5201]
MKILLRNSSIQKIFILLIPIVIFIAGCEILPFGNKPFDQKAWLANPVNSGKNDSIRFQMSEDLTKNHLKIGMTRQQTRKLLGKPDLLNSYCYGKDICDNYYLGEYALILNFDSTGKLIKKDIISI